MFLSSRAPIDNRLLVAPIPTVPRGVAALSGRLDPSGQGCPSRPAADTGRDGGQAASSKQLGRAPHRSTATSAAEKRSRRVRAPGLQRGRRRRVRGRSVRAVAPRRCDYLAGQRRDTPDNRPLKSPIRRPKDARHEYCRNFPPTRLAFCPRGRMMAVFRFQHATLLEAESDEGVGAEWRTSRRHRSRRRMPGGRAGAREENENNLLAVLDKSSMHPHNRQFSTEGCPSG